MGDMILLWGMGLALIAGAIGFLFDTKAWGRLQEIPANELGPTVVYGLVPVGAIVLTAVLWSTAPFWLPLPAILILQHLALIRACRRHEARRARIVEGT